MWISQDFCKTKQLQKTYCLAENELKFIWEHGALWIESNKPLNFASPTEKLPSRDINVNNELNINSGIF